MRSLGKKTYKFGTTAKSAASSPRLSRWSKTMRFRTNDPSSLETLESIIENSQLMSADLPPMVYSPSNIRMSPVLNRKRDVALAC